MVARHETSVVPAEFREAVTAMRAAVVRPEVLCEEMPAPQRIAPHAAALSGDVTIDGEDVGTGRIIVLHDPEGHEAWQGTFRCVAYCRADIEPEQVTDPLLAQVGWTWLVEALGAHDADHTALSGSVTTVATEGFGGMAEDGATAQLEIRASWTPVGPPHLVQNHVEAWGELLCTASGLEPVPEGVAVMPTRRGQRGAATP